jgi:hypothetical protein
MHSTSPDTRNQPRTNSHSSLSATDIGQFARLHRLNWRLDDCGDPIISGKHGEVGEHGDGRLDACFHGEGPEPFSRLRANRIRQALQHSIGERITGTAGADEALFAFDPSNENHLAWFIRALGIKRKRRVTLQTLERLRRFRNSRQSLAGRPFQTPESADDVTAGPEATASLCSSATTSTEEK